ncbi:MAG: Ldh family oxidoreductase [Desulfobacterales bacterium]|jgi:L-lactate dehydrogenase
MNEKMEKYRAADLDGLARQILIAAGLEQEKAAAVANGLLEGDLMGATTHGLALLAGYVDELENGEMTATGNPEVLSDFGATTLWDGRYLPGIWLTREAGLEASRRAAKFGIGLVTIRRSHHIACLGHYLLAAVERGDIMLIYSSDPSDSHVAPYGGVSALMTPNPIAVGIPAQPWPILLDASTSITTAGLCERSHREGKRLPGKWLLTPAGELSDDPAVFGPPQGGTILPVGGLDHGHKGYGLSLMVEALTQGLSGFGRPQKPTTWGAAVTVQVIRPEAFLPMEEFQAQVDWLVSACLNGEKRPGIAEIVVPGQREMIRRDEALRSGLTLYPGVTESLVGLTKRYGLPLPTPIGTERNDE